MRFCPPWGIRGLFVAFDPQNQMALVRFAGDYDGRIVRPPLASFLQVFEGRQVELSAAHADVVSAMAIDAIGHENRRNIL